MIKWRKAEKYVEEKKTRDEVKGKRETKRYHIAKEKRKEGEEEQR